MKLIAFETSTPSLGVALWMDQPAAASGPIAAEVAINQGFRHAETLLPTLQWLLRQVRWSLPEIHGVAVSVGPGSFTGIRLGVTAARALGQALGCPLIGVPTLDALAAEALERDADRQSPAPFIVPMIPTLREEVFTAVYTSSTWPFVKRLTPLQTTDVPRWLDQLTRLRLPALRERSTSRRWIFVGAGAVRHHQALQRWRGTRTLPVIARASGPGVGTIARLGAAAFSRGKGQRFDKVVPVYLRPCSAEERLR